MKKIIVVIVILILTLTFINSSFAKRSRDLDITTLIYNTSPGFPYQGHASIIQAWLLFYLEGSKL